MRRLMLLALAVTTSAAAQNADFKALMERTNADVPVPAKAVIEVDALKTLVAIAKEERAACVPIGVELGEPKPMTSASLAVAGITAGKLKNAWTAYGRAKGCPSALPTRFMILQLADDQVLARTVNEGESLANPSVMRDSSTHAALAAYQIVRSAQATCTGDDMRMLATKVVSKSSDLGPDFYGSYFTGSWQEAWTFRVCGKSVEVPISFRADGQGGAYSEVKGSEAKLID